MANEKTIRTRIQNRHAPESYWVSNNTFVPRAGEIIIYDVDTNHSHPRVKIGDGQTTIVNLPFSDATVLGETADTAYRGDRGKTAYDHAFAKGSAYSSGLYKVTTNEQGHVTNATPVVKKDITDLGVPAQDTTYDDATQTTHGLMSANDKKKLDNAKELQTAVSDPTASGTAVEFISGISQNDKGVISPSKKTVRTMGAASANAAGSTGLVPAPAKGDQVKFLNGAGQWQTPTNTKNTAGSTDSSSKLFLIGATSQAASPQTYSHDTAYVGTDGCLYSGGKKVLTDHQDISGKVPTSRKINNKALSADITLTGEDIPVSSTNASSLSQQIANLENICNRNAGFHNSIFRGKSLGNSLTTEQKTAIQNGTFDDLFIGDYWTISGIDYVICHFDYYYNCSDSNINYHHVVVMPRGTMTGLSITLLDGESSGAYKWNSSNTTAGGYIASRMRTVIMPACDTIVKAAFGSGNVHAISELYPSAFVSTTDGRATSWAWTSTDLICDLCNETMVYGQQVWGLGGAHGQQGFEVGIDKWQLAIFRLYPAFANTRAHWWLRSVYSASNAAYVSGNGSANSYGASNAFGVRPRFLVS